MRECNSCFKPVESRVEVLTTTYRLVACGECAVAEAVECAQSGKRCVISSAPLGMLSPFVASDEAYFPNERDARTHQNALDAKADRFAVRIRQVIALTLAAADHRSVA